MLNSDNVFSAATTLMTRHVMGQQAAVEVIDELEAMFKPATMTCTGMRNHLK
jgi:hypothetical protein